MSKKDPLKHFTYPTDPKIVPGVRKWYRELQMDELIKNLKNKNYDAFYASTKKEALKLIMKLIPEGATVGLGGSMTAAEIGIHKALEEGNYMLYNQYKAGIAKDKAAELRTKGLTAEYYVTGTNALTIEGELINLDGLGNRVAAITYGPEKVIIIVGINKIVPSIDAGIERTENYAAVLNCKRLNTDTPCVKAGVCVDCNVPTRICNHLLITYQQRKKGRVTVVIVGEELGF